MAAPSNVWPSFFSDSKSSVFITVTIADFTLANNDFGTFTEVSAPSPFKLLYGVNSKSTLLSTIETFIMTLSLTNSFTFSFSLTNLVKL